MGSKFTLTILDTPWLTDHEAKGMRGMEGYCHISDVGTYEMCIVPQSYIYCVHQGINLSINLAPVHVVLVLDLRLDLTGKLSGNC